MSTLTHISGKEAVKAFHKAGWHQAGQVGCHLVMIKPGPRVNLSIPQHKQLSTETLAALLRSAELPEEDFLKLLK